MPDTKKKAFRLTSSQLSDLYRRLDTNNDGKLDIDEFYQISKRLAIRGDAGVATITEDQLLQAFNLADGNQSGGLSESEFRMAYDILYYGTLVENARAPGDTYLRATRYGFDNARGGFVFECYTGTIFALSEYWDYREADKYMPIPCTGDLGTIYKMVLQDGQANMELGSNVMWWLDVSAESISTSVVAILVNKLGLPNDIEANLSRTHLQSNRDSRIRVGSGYSYVGLEVESLSLFTQSMHLENVPIVNSLVEPDIPPEVSAGDNRVVKGEGADAVTPFTYIAAAYRAVKTYVNTRVAPFMSYRNTPDSGRANAVKRAEALANHILDIDGELPTHLRDRAALLSTSALPLPLENASPGEFLLSHKDMLARPPHLVTHQLSMHLLDHGYGSNSLLTLRQIDKERGLHTTSLGGTVTDASSRWCLDQRARAGILGRLQHGLWKKLMVLMLENGVAPSMSELADSSSSLFHALVLLLHSLNMDCMVGLEKWLLKVDHGIQDLTETKYLSHIQRASNLLLEVRDYLDPMRNILNAFTASWHDGHSGKKESGDPTHSTQKENGRAPMVASGTSGLAGGDAEGVVGDTVLPIPPISEETVMDDDEQRLPPPPPSSRVGASHRSMDGNEATIIDPSASSSSSGKDLAPPFRVGLRQAAASATVAQGGVLDSTEFELVWSTVSKFLGPRRQDFLSLLKGNPQIEVKGLEFWCSFYDTISRHLRRIQGMYNVRVAEKRNFWTMLLTLVMASIFPLFFTTAYWSMNFEEEDMKEYKSGVHVAWDSWAVMYSFAFLAVFHYKLLDLVR